MLVFVCVCVLFFATRFNCLVGYNQNRIAQYHKAHPQDKQSKWTPITTTATTTIRHSKWNRNHCSCWFASQKVQPSCCLCLHRRRHRRYVTTLIQWLVEFANKIHFNIHYAVGWCECACLSLWWIVPTLANNSISASLDQNKMIIVANIWVVFVFVFFSQLKFNGDLHMKSAFCNIASLFIASNLMEFTHLSKEDKNIFPSSNLIMRFFHEQFVHLQWNKQRTSDSIIDIFSH